MRPSVVPEPHEAAPTAWTGTVVFAGVLMFLVGTFQVVEGLVTLFDRGYYRVAENGLVVTSTTPSGAGSTYSSASSSASVASGHVPAASSPAPSVSRWRS